MADDYYAKIASAAASGGGTYINDGRYKLMIERMFRKDSDFAGGGTSFIAEFRVIESEADPSHPEVKPNPVGSTCSAVAVVTKHASAFSNIKALLLGALGAFGYTEEQITGEVIAEAFTTDQLRGVMLEDNTYRKKTRSTGKEITLNKWTPIVQTEEQVAQQKKDLDAGKYSKARVEGPASQAAQTETARPTSLLRRG